MSDDDENDDDYEAMDADNENIMDILIDDSLMIQSDMALQESIGDQGSTSQAAIKQERETVIDTSKILSKVASNMELTLQYLTGNYLLPL